MRAYHRLELLLTPARITIAGLLILVLQFILSESASRGIQAGDATSLLRTAALEVGIPVFWILSLAVPALFIVVAVAASFKRRASRGERLWLVVSAYASIIMAFAGLYYSMSVFDDYHDALSKYDYYLRAGARWRTGEIKQIQRIADQRAFRGVAWRTWSGVDWSPPGGGIPAFDESSPRPVERMADEARRDFKDVVRFVPAARFYVLIDSLHLSVVTMATLGYGDISPMAWYAKLFADLQVISAVVLFGGALGMLFSGWWERPKY